MAAYAAHSSTAPLSFWLRLCLPVIVVVYWLLAINLHIFYLPDCRQHAVYVRQCVRACVCACGCSLLCFRFICICRKHFSWPAKFYSQSAPPHTSPMPNEQALAKMGFKLTESIRQQQATNNAWRAMQLLTCATRRIRNVGGSPVFHFCRLLCCPLSSASSANYSRALGARKQMHQYLNRTSN